jgi:DNA invertase Pin-like site-specific DNA recombinase
MWPKVRRDRRLQGRSADLRACRVRQAIELVEAHGVFFISVTRVFNTITSMGRLTLNMLFSK